jgi:hypothetical protein
MNQNISEKTNVVFVVDESSSMSPFANVLPKEFEKIYNTIPRGNAVRVIKFASLVSEPAEKLEGYRPDGMTALYDAIHKAIDISDDGKTPTLIIVLTDGEENQSVKNSASTLAKRIQRKQASDLFTFTFGVPAGMKYGITAKLGVFEGNVMEWDTAAAPGTQAYADAGLGRATARQFMGTQSYFAARSRGETSVKGFYSDASKVTPRDLSQLDIVPVKVLPVVKEAEIRPFIEYNNLPFYPGCAAYQLTKPELVQAGKDLFLMEKGKKVVYGGDEVRGLLGLPPGTDAKVTPGNHANFDIFVQSTSVNRKLVRGTKVLYGGTLQQKPETWDSSSVVKR